jgi:hypothetical protein
MFRHLHIYTVHTKPTQPLKDMLPVFVREGFNWYAFLFTFFWALYNRLWLVSTLVLSFNILVGVLQEAGMLTEGSGVVVLIASQVIMGFEGNDWLRGKLARRGYITAGIISGDSLLRAQQRFFDQLTGAPAHASA